MEKISRHQSQSNLTEEGVREVLRGTFDPQKVKLATEYITAWTVEPTFLLHLASILSKDVPREEKQAAASALKGALPKGWTLANAEDRLKVAGLVKQSLILVTDPVVGIGLGRCMAVICVLEPQYVTPTIQLVSSLLAEGPAKRVAAYRLVDYLVHVTTEINPAIVAILERGLGTDDEEAIQVACLESVEELVLKCVTEHDVDSVRRISRPLVSCCEVAMGKAKEEVISRGAQILQIIASNTSMLQRAEVSVYSNVFLRICGDKNLSIECRSTGFDGIHVLSKHWPRVLIQDRMLQPILNEAVQVACEKDVGEEEVLIDFSDSSITPLKVGTKAVDSLAVNFPDKFVYGPLLDRLTPLTKSTNPENQRVALVLLGIISEGCEASMKLDLEKLLPFVIRSLREVAALRSTAAFCLGQMAEYLRPEIGQYHKEAMAAILVGLSAEDEDAAGKSAYALELFCDSLEPSDVLSYIPLILPALYRMLSSAKGDDAKRLALGGIGSAATAAGDQIQPYLREIATVLEQGIRQPSNGVRTTAVRYAGAISASVTQHFEPYRDHFVSIICEIMKSSEQDFEFREATFHFFKCLAASMGDNLAPMLPRLFSWVFESVKITDDLSMENVKCMTDEQEAVANFLNAVVNHVGMQHYQAYNTKILDYLATLNSHFRSTIRRFVPTIIVGLMDGYLGMHPPGWTGTSWTPGLPAACPLHPQHAVAWGDQLWPLMREIILEDTDKDVVSECCTSVGEMAEKMGPCILIHDCTITLMNVCRMLLTSSHPCQSSGDLLLDDNEDSRAAEENLFDGLSTLIIGLAAATGDQFGTAFDGFQPQLLQLAVHPASKTYRSIGLGCFAEILRSIHGTSLKDSALLVSSCLEGIRQVEHVQLQRNATYFVGVLVQCYPSDPHVRVHLMDILHALHKYLTLDHTDLNEPEQCVTDNACGALARIILSIEPEALPLSEVLPGYFHSLPLKADHAESDVVLQSLLKMSSNDACSAVLGTLVPQFLTAITDQVLSPHNEAGDDINKQVKSTVKNLVQRVGVENVPQLSERLARL